MGVINIDDMKDQVEELVSRVQAGETILIEKDGKTVARLEGVEVTSALGAPGKKIDVAALKEFTRSLPPSKESAVELIRRMRDDGF